MLPDLSKEEQCRPLLEQEQQELELEQQEQKEKEKEKEDAAFHRVAQLGKTHQRASSDTSTIDFR